jgi:hypothetical protein
MDPQAVVPVDPCCDRIESGFHKTHSTGLPDAARIMTASLCHCLMRLTIQTSGNVSHNKTGHETD